MFLFNFLRTKTLKKRMQNILYEKNKTKKKHNFSGFEIYEQKRQNACKLHCLCKQKDITRAMYYECFSAC